MLGLSSIDFIDMASSRAIMILSLLVLALSPSVVQARMMPSDQPQMLAEKTATPPLYSSSPDLLRAFMAPPPSMPVMFAATGESMVPSVGALSMSFRGRFRAPALAITSSTIF
ncbi:hypothetical protein ZWY2020_020568 [Hordeum vulgare]|nr:hypothetical protein ZWY2020_020568 [Hordeum vulgare]